MRNGFIETLMLLRGALKNAKEFLGSDDTYSFRDLLEIQAKRYVEYQGNTCQLNKIGITRIHEAEEIAKNLSVNYPFYSRNYNYPVEPPESLEIPKGEDRAFFAATSDEFSKKWDLSTDWGKRMHHYLDFLLEATQ